MSSTLLRTVDLREQATTSDFRSLVPRAAFDVEAALDVVRPICDDVAARGTEALYDYAERFDHVRPADLRVPAAALAQAAEQLDPELRAAFEVSINRRRQVAQTERGELAAEVAVAPGAQIGVRQIPVNRVGLYVPGGLAPLSSSVIMNVVPAQVAGVAEIALASPPQQEFGGLPHPAILAVAHLLGVTEVYAVGGAQAIAMFAHGVAGLCPRVDLVTGPGNIYVTAAKRLLRSKVGIDSEAGPTEIAILADDTADPDFVAADLISQAEHDPMAAAVLVTDSPALADQVQQAVREQVAVTKHTDRIRAALTGEQSGIVLVTDLEQGIAVVDAYAAEHLELQVRDAAQVAARIRNAGAIFIGPYAPVSLGDYCAGSTHVLPTAGCACHSSGLNVRSFLRSVHLISYSAEALSEVAHAVEVFADAEDLPAHGNAVTVRRSRSNQGSDAP